MSNSRKLKYWLVFSDYCPNGRICSDLELRDWMDETAYKVEVEKGMRDDVNTIIKEFPDQLPIGKANKPLTKKAIQ